MDAPYLNKAGLENQSLVIRNLWFKMTLVGHTTAASCKMYSDTSGVYGYVEGDTVSGVDTDTGFPTTLDVNGDPFVGGILVASGDAVELVSVFIPKNGIVGGTGWTTPSGTETSQGSGGTAVVADITIGKGAAAVTGITTSSNIAFGISINGLDLDANISTHTFWVNVVYKAAQSVTG